MTNDHWIQIAIGVANAIAVLATAILTPVIASRINQPKPKFDTASPKSKTWNIWSLRAAWVTLGLLFAVNILGLSLDMRLAPLTRSVVVSISMHIAGIGFNLAMMFVLLFSEILRSMIESRDQFHDQLFEIVREIAKEAERRHPFQT
jgi:hypothetical protein